ncbi:MAG: GAF domain-containing protein [Aggregatilineales bacterium]
MVTNPMAVVQSENARLKTENQQLTAELRNLREFVEVLNELNNKPVVKDDADIMPTLRDIFHKALHLLNAPDGSLALLDDDKKELVFVLVRGALADKLTGYRIPADTGIAGWVVQNVKSALVRDVRRDQRFFSDVDEEFKFTTQSIAAAPLVGDGNVIGLIEVLNQPGDVPFSETDTALLGLLCRIAGEHLANVQRNLPTEEGETT